MSREGFRINRIAAGVLKVGAIALLVALAMPGRAADDRPVKSRVAPVYPELAKRMRISGAVQLEVSVNQDGKVTDVKTVAGNHALALAAEDAVRQWRFAPAPAPSTQEVSVNFALTQ